MLSAIDFITQYKLTLQMHQFPFFEPVAVKDVHDLASSPDVFKARRML